jgi:hypothetical protein
MADIKISALPAATTPLAGTEVLPIVQSGVTAKVSISNLTAGRSVSATTVAITGSTSGTATIVTPAVAGTPTITLPIVTGTLATLAGTETLTNKTLTSPVLDTAVTGTAVATQAQQETASVTNVLVTPGRQQFHPSAAKAWVKFNSAATVAASYNITSVTDNGTGTWTVNIATDFSSSDYCGVAFGGYLSSGPTPLIYNLFSTAAAGTFQIAAFSAAGTLTDPNVNEIYAAFFGDQA